MLTHRPGDPDERRLTLRPRERIELALLPRAGRRWRSVRSSAPQLATVAGWHVDEDGTAYATVTGLRAGVATVTVHGDGATLTVRVSVAPYPIAG